MKLFLPIVILITSNCYGQFYFNNTYDISNTPEVYIGLSYNPADSTFYAHGNAVGDNRPYIVKLDYFGNKIDSFLLENDHSGSIYGAGLSVSIDLNENDGIYTAGFLQHTTGSATGLLCKLDDQGDTSWTYQTDSLGNSDGFNSVVIDSDTTIIIAGPLETGSNGSHDFWLLKIDSSGNVLWENNYGGIQRDYPMSVDTTVDDGYVISGYTESYGNGGRDFYVVKVDNSGGLVWEKWFGLGGHDAAYTTSLPNGEFLVYNGFNYENPQVPGQFAVHAVVIKLDANGNQIWMKEYSRFETTDPEYYIEDENFNAVVTTTDGYVFVGTTRDSIDGIPLGWLLKTDFSGNELWSRTFRKRNSANYLHDILYLSSNEFVLSGFVAPEGTFTNDGWLIRTNCLGFDGPPVAAGIWHNGFQNEVVLENDSENFGNGIIYWDDGDSTLITEFDDSLITHIYASSGSYDITLIVNACGQSDTTVITANASVLSIEEKEAATFELYPNPANDEVTIKWLNLPEFEQETTIAISDLNGKLVFQEIISNSAQSYTVSVDHFEKGLYLVQMVSANGTLLTKKLIVQ